MYVVGKEWAEFVERSRFNFDDPLGCVVLFYMMDSTLLLRYSTVTYFES